MGNKDFIKIQHIKAPHRVKRDSLMLFFLGGVILSIRKMSLRLTLFSQVSTQTHPIGANALALVHSVPLVRDGQVEWITSPLLLRVIQQSNAGTVT